MNTLKVSAVTLLAAVIFALLKSRRSEYAVLLAVGFSAVLLFSISAALSPYVSALGEVFSAVDSEVLNVSLKAVGIGCVTALAASVASDSGMSSAAETVRFAGKAALFVLSFPLFKKLLDTGLSLL